MGLTSCLCNTLAWVIAVPVHAAILVLIALAILYWQNWPAALAGSLAYLVILIIITRRYHNKVADKHAIENSTTNAGASGTSASQGDGGEEEEQKSQTSTSSSVNRIRRRPTPANIPFGLSLMYFLTNIILALPGAITVFFAFPCGDIDPDTVRRQVYWKTNMTALPEDVQTWMNSFQVGRTTSPSIAHSSSQLYVYGVVGDQNPQLYAFEDVGADPVSLGYEGMVHDLVAVTDTAVCFVHSTEGFFQSHITCGEYGQGFQDLELPRNRYSFGLTSIDGVLWFLQIRSDYYFFDPLSGGSCNFKAVAECDGCFFPACSPDTMRVMSLDVDTMELVSHSTRVATRGLHNRRRQLQEDKEDEAEDVQDDDNIDAEQDDDEMEEILDSDMFCDGAMLTRLRSLGALLLSALPLFFNSSRVWISYAIPSASVTLFISIAYAFFCIWGVFSPSLAEDGLRLWMAFGTPIWLLVCTYQVVVNNRLSKEPLYWSIYLITTGMVMLLVIQEYFEIYNLRIMDGSEITMWLVDV
jgi:uncharacterized membrane protein